MKKSQEKIDRRLQRIEKLRQKAESGTLPTWQAYEQIMILEQEIKRLR